QDSGWLSRLRQHQSPGWFEIVQSGAVPGTLIFHAPSRRTFTFKSKEAGWDAFREYFRFAGTYLFSFILGLILLPLFVEVLGMTPQVAAAVIILICTVFSYLGHTRFSSRSH
ncbi:MAG: GtrA family protein, partial [Syntrophus sp. (in: bacteria)]